MNLNKAEKRDRKRVKRNKMVVDNKSIFTVQATIIKKGHRKPKKEK